MANENRRQKPLQYDPPACNATACGLSSSAGAGAAADPHACHQAAGRLPATVGVSATLSQAFSRPTAADPAAGDGQCHGPPGDHRAAQRGGAAGFAAAAPGAFPRRALREVAVEPFGKIEVHHGDIFSFWEKDLQDLAERPKESSARAAARSMVLPMSPNLLPYRGLGLEAFDRGGALLVRETFEEAKREFGIENPENEKETKIHLEPGNVVQLPLHHLAPPLVRRQLQEGDCNWKNRIMFMIMPWVWEGSPMDAAKRFRFCTKRAFESAVKHCKKVSQEAEAKMQPYEGTVALPNLGGGIYGYEPRSSSVSLVEEAFETLLQVEASDPCYALRRICFVEADLETATSLAESLVQVSHRWLPEQRLTTAPEWWGRQTRRLLVLPAKPNFFWRKFRVKFKQRHGVKKRELVNYEGNVVPFLWRAQKVRQPPPLLVHQSDGRLPDPQRQLNPGPTTSTGSLTCCFPTASVASAV
ncbi:unnamed protein product [Effrenium voratum]|uniref:Macro domain-containing protein n=1 Tax=Effrenium voratum TaxID=2562239 RepID=A0AA36IEQ3_9DINO|nr:unnamed protein product [Effrenium voratum]